MIILENVSKYYPTKFGRNYVLRDVSITLPRDRNIGILGVNGAGKSTLLRLLGGMDMPSKGKVMRRCRVSWTGKHSFCLSYTWGTRHKGD